MSANYDLTNVREDDVSSNRTVNWFVLCYVYQSSQRYRYSINILLRCFGQFWRTIKSSGWFIHYLCQVLLKYNVLGSIYYVCNSSFSLSSTGSPRYDGNIQKIIDTACKEAELYSKYKLVSCISLNRDYWRNIFSTNYRLLLVPVPKGGICMENMHDLPYVKSELVGCETVSAMTSVCYAVRNIVPSSIPCGVQVQTFVIHNHKKGEKS